MKNLLFLIFTFFAVQVINAQTWALDPTFGEGGISHTTIQGNGASGHSVAIQSDGKIVMVGETATYQGSVVRFNTDGSLDNSFGTNGTVLIPKIGQNDYLLDVAIQSDGKIVATGYSHRLSGYDIILIRLNSDGTLDNTLGGSGRSALDIEGNVDIVEAIVIQPDGKYLLGGYSDYEFVVVRLNPDGLPDDTFGGAVIGVAKTEFSIANSSSVVDIALQSDGKIVAVGNTMNSFNYNKFAVARYNADGTPDITFGTDGKETYVIGSQHDFLTSVAIQSDGKILLGGHTYIATGPKYDIAVVRLNENGTADNTFGVSGVAKARIVDGANYTNDIAVQTDGKIVVAGYTVSVGYEIGVARFNSDGTLDNSFTPTGTIHSDILALEDYGEAVALQSDGKIIVAGRAYSNTSSEFICVRYSGQSVEAEEIIANVLSIYPNPAMEVLKIETNSKCKIEIIDLSGKIVFSTIAENQIMVDVSSFSKGLYFVKACTNNSTEVIKLVVE